MDAIFRRFQKDRAATFIPVVDPEGRAVGLLTESRIKAYVYSPYGRELLRKKTVESQREEFLSDCPRLNESAPLEAALDLYAANPQAEGFLVESDAGAYRGYLPVRALVGLSHARENESAERHRLELAAQHDRIERQHRVAEEYLGLLRDLVGRLMPRAEEMTETIRNAAVHSRSMGALVGEVTRIARQTNMVSLNAAIEAAKAREAGLGFSVVADKVKQLSGQTTETARHINDHVGQIQRDMLGVNRSLEEVAAILRELNAVANPAPALD